MCYCRQCHKQGGGRLLLVVIVAVFIIAIVLMFVRDWGSPETDTTGSGWTVKLKIVITHLQVGCSRPSVVPETLTSCNPRQPTQRVLAGRSSS